ncbi:fimbrillin family protein [Prevotella sp. E9-3]|nr:fimbrillin family protein [Prevotella sp. E9-3]UKK49659.1 fimbrillin family protein [Prevotella sp. E9-3]
MGTLASCQSDDEATANSFARPDNAVGINVSVGSLKATTRSNPASTDFDQARIFNQGDQISVSTNDQEAVIFQCQNADQQTWAEAEAGKFLLWTQSEMTFKAYYPVTTGTSMTAFTVPTDQSSVDKIALADYMTRTQNISRPEGGSDIQMQLERKMARVIVRISGFGSQYRDDQKTVDNVRIYSEASGIANGNPTGSSTEIQPYAQGSNNGWGWSQNSTFTALVVPGDGDSGARFIQLTDGEGSTLLVKGIPELEASNSYTFNLVVGKNRILVQSVTVTDWTTGGQLAGGQATENLSTPLNNTTTAWTAGTFAVPAGGLTYSDAITVSGDVTLVLTDGTTLTLNKGISLADGATLTIQGNGTMNVNGTDGNTSSTVGGNHGTLVLTSGTLTARGGNGGSGGNEDLDVHGGNGGVAINGSVIVSGGTLTARGGNGGSVGYECFECSGGNGGDAISGTLTINGGSTSVNDGSNGSIGSECIDCTAGTGGKGHN